MLDVIRSRNPAMVPGVRRASSVVVGTWVLFGLAVAVQWLAQAVVPATAPELRLFHQDVWLVGLWALGLPAIVWSAGRFPIGRDSWRGHVPLHASAATLFIVATNVAIRAPFVFPPLSLGVTWLVADTVRGLARFYPTALVVYAVLVAVGQYAWSSGGIQPAADAEPITDGVDAGKLMNSGADGEPASPPPERVVVREWNRTHLVRPTDIEWIEADDNNIVVHAAGRTYKGRGRIRDLETQLDAAAFVRIHRSAIVPVAGIREVQPLNKGDFVVILHGGKTLRVARTRRAALETALRVPL